MLERAGDNLEPRSRAGREGRTIFYLEHSSVAADTALRHGNINLLAHEGPLQTEPQLGP